MNWASRISECFSCRQLCGLKQWIEIVKVLGTHPQQERTKATGRIAEASICSTKVPMTMRDWTHESSPSVKGEVKTTLSWDTKAHRLQCLESRTLMTPDAGDVEQQEHSFTAGGDAAWCSHLGGEVGNFLQKLTYLTIHSNNHAPWYLSKYVEDLSTQKPAWESS